MRPKRVCWSERIGLCAAFILALLLAVSPLSSPDLGYHLSYGETFLDTGIIVDHNDFIYTLPERSSHCETGPGCWYDSDGRYRFPNANWLSQVIMAGLWRLGGSSALCLLQLILIFCIFALVVLTMRRLRVAWPVAAACICLTAVAAHARFSLRPEVFGYVILCAQLSALSGRRITWPDVAALVALQILFVNCHSYFLLSLAITFAFMAGRFVSWKFRTLRSGQTRHRTSQLASDVSRLALILILQVAASFLNPWTWRIVLLPVQTMLFMYKNNIAASSILPGGHPWSYIGEFFQPLAGAFANTKATYAFFVLLGFAGAGALVAFVSRRWAWLLVLVGMVAVALSMRRNMAPGAFIIAPIAAAAVSSGGRRICYVMGWAGSLRTLRGLTSTIVAAVSLWCSITVVTQSFYFQDRLGSRFGWGISSLHVPMDVADWVRNNAAQDRVWTDYDTSSNIHYFAGGVAVPIITNTWAYPPKVMRTVLDTYSGTEAFNTAAAKYAFHVAVFRANTATAPLVKELADSSRWKVVTLSAAHVVFADQLIGTQMTESDLDVSSYIEAARSSDSVPAHALHIAGLTCYHLGWNTAAAECFSAAIGECPFYHEAWNMKGLCLAELGTVLVRQTGNKGLLRQAQECFRTAIQLQGDYGPARTNLQVVNRELGS